MAIGTEEEKQNLWQIMRSFAYAFIFAFAVRSLTYQPFHIPSVSMEGTLLVGDYLFSSKYSYGYSRFSFPLSLPIFKGRIFEKIPERGDIVIFRRPTDLSENYIKRLIGLPNDKIQVKNGVLYINGEAIPRKLVEPFVKQTENGEKKITRYEETLPNGVKYHVLDEDPNGSLDNTGVYTVPEGHYFFMGDNRDNSTDSRVLNVVGFVPAENLVGKAEIVAFSIGENASFLKVWKWKLKTERFLKSL